MTVNLTNEQIARLFHLCEKIVAVKRSMPIPPKGMDGELELAKNLRSSIEKENDVLLELGALLR